LGIEGIVDIAFFSSGVYFDFFPNDLQLLRKSAEFNVNSQRRGDAKKLSSFPCGVAARRQTAAD